ncbi:MAG: hypothetical protein ACR2HP_14380 [Ilumatobacteraceae bacterium]
MLNAPPLARAVAIASPIRTTTVTAAPLLDQLSSRPPWRLAIAAALDSPPSIDARAAASAAVWALAASITSPAMEPKAIVKIAATTITAMASGMACPASPRNRMAPPPRRQARPSPTG